MKNKHEREVLEKLVKGEITKKDCEDALDMGRTGCVNRLFNISLEIFRENNIKM